MQIPIEQAYALACQKIGEGAIREAYLNEILAQREAQVAELTEKCQAAGLIEEATEIVEGAADANLSQQQGGLPQDHGVSEPTDQG